jgi:hypothetical protein
MRNLEVLSRKEANTRPNGLITHFAQSTTKDNLFFVTSANVLQGYDIIENKAWLELNLDHEDLLPSSSQILGIEYIPDLNAVCLASRSGEIILYEVSNNEVILILSNLAKRPNV